MKGKNLFLTQNKISMNPIMNAPMSKGRVYEQSLEKYFELTEQEDLAKLVANIDSSPLPPPMRSTNMKMPQKMPNAVRNVRVLLRESESKISSHWSLSNLIFILSMLL